jgi:hypothetical protein
VSQELLPSDSSTKGRLQRTLLLAGAELFVVSVTFPIVACLFPPDAIPPELGIVDVAIAIALVGVGIAIVGLQPRSFPSSVVASCFRVYRGLASALLLLLVLFLWAGDSIRWSVLLVGLAWRGWLFVLVLPSWLTSWAQVAKAPHERDAKPLLAHGAAEQGDEADER